MALRYTLCASQKILGQILRILCLPRATAMVILNRGLNTHNTANAQDTLVIDVNSIVMPQLVIDAPVTFIRAFPVNLFYRFGNLHIFGSPAAHFAGCPSVICCP